MQSNHQNFHISQTWLSQQLSINALWTTRFNVGRSTLLESCFQVFKIVSNHISWSHARHHKPNNAPISIGNAKTINPTIEGHIQNPNFITLDHNILGNGMMQVFYKFFQILPSQCIWYSLSSLSNSSTYCYLYWCLCSWDPRCFDILSTFFLYHISCRDFRFHGKWFSYAAPRSSGRLMHHPHYPIIYI